MERSVKTIKNVNVAFLTIARFLRDDQHQRSSGILPPQKTTSCFFSFSSGPGHRPQVCHRVCPRDGRRAGAPLRVQPLRQKGSPSLAGYKSCSLLSLVHCATSLNLIGWLQKLFSAFIGASHMSLNLIGRLQKLFSALIGASRLNLIAGYKSYSLLSSVHRA